MSAYYGSGIGDHWVSIAFLFSGYLGCLVWIKLTSRRAPGRAETPPVSGPAGRTSGRLLAHALDAARFSGPTTEAERPAQPFDWNA